LRELISADARLEVADRFSGRLADSPYFGRYDLLTIVWRTALGVVDGDPAIVMLRRDESGWMPHSLVRLSIVDQRVVGVSDYLHCPWMIPAATSFGVSLTGAEP
jgi:RNA polymerase sigma-70 factor (ECF subfamily)